MLRCTECISLVSERNLRLKSQNIQVPQITSPANRRHHLKFFMHTKGFHNLNYQKNCRN